MRKVLVALVLLPAALLPPAIQAQSDASVRVLVGFASARRPHAAQQLQEVTGCLH